VAVYFVETRALANRAMLLAEQHGLCGYDAMQLAAGCEVHVRYLAAGLPAVIFMSADTELNTAAIRVVRDLSDVSSADRKTSQAMLDDFASAWLTICTVFPRLCFPTIAWRDGSSQTVHGTSRQCSISAIQQKESSAPIRCRILFASD
jgi:hypothetical protein